MGEQVSHNTWFLSSVLFCFLITFVYLSIAHKSFCHIGLEA